MAVIIEDIYMANYRSLEAKLTGELSECYSIISASREGGDYQYTVEAQAKLLEATLEALEQQHIQNQLY
jgi:hypothetical protein